MAILYRHEQQNPASTFIGLSLLSFVYLGMAQPRKSLIQGQKTTPGIMLGTSVGRLGVWALVSRGNNACGNPLGLQRRLRKTRHYLIKIQGISVPHGVGTETYVKNVDNLCRKPVFNIHASRLISRSVPCSVYCRSSNGNHEEIPLDCR